MIGIHLSSRQDRVVLKAIRRDLPVILIAGGCVMSMEDVRSLWIHPVGLSIVWSVELAERVKRWRREVELVNSALHPSGVAKSSTSFGWGKGWNVTSAGWQVTLCDPIWHVSSSSGVATSVSELLYLCYLLTYLLTYLSLWTIW